MLMLSRYQSDNLLSKLEIPNIITANICQSKKKLNRGCEVGMMALKLTINMCLISCFYQNNF